MTNILEFRFIYKNNTSYIVRLATERTPQAFEFRSQNSLSCFIPVTDIQELGKRDLQEQIKAIKALREKYNISLPLAKAIWDFAGEKYGS